MRVQLLIPPGEMKPGKLANKVIPYGEFYSFNKLKGDVLGSASPTHTWVRFDCLNTTPKFSSDDRQTMYVSCPNKYLIRITE